MASEELGNPGGTLLFQKFAGEKLKISLSVFFANCVIPMFPKLTLKQRILGPISVVSLWGFPLGAKGMLVPIIFVVRNDASGSWSKCPDVGQLPRDG